MLYTSRRQQHSKTVQAKLRTTEASSFGQDDENEADDVIEPMELEAEDERIHIDYKNKNILNDISDLFEICKKKCGLKSISCLLYMSLRHVGITYEKCDDILKTIGGYTSQTAQKWTEVLVNGNFGDFMVENRGGKHCSSFYDYFPEIETEAKLYSLERCGQKAADFSALDLAHFIDKRFYEESNIVKNDDSALIRSVASCRLDLRRWGAKFDKNSQRPYFEGHERDDVKEHRSKFVEYFLTRKANYYMVTEGENPVWKVPTANPPCVHNCYK
ncbi:unnamed protein product, partial [Didymodactylos carnosus]